MGEIKLPDYHIYRRRTRTYDTPSENTKEMFEALVAVSMPAGTFIPTALSAQPDGDAWLLCDGQQLLKSDYPRLYAVFGGKFGESGATFNLPDLRGRMLIGAGGAAGVDISVAAGQADITLAPENMPRHSHAVTDPGHDHTFNPTPHSHGVTDPGHDHGGSTGGAPDAAAGVDQATVEAGTTASATTGISVDPATAGGSIATKTTGISIQDAGDGQPVNIIPPVIGVNWLVRT